MILELTPLVVTVLCLSLALLIPGVMRSIANLVASLPWVGGHLANAVNGMAQAISGFLGDVFGPITSAVGTMFHWVARQVDNTYNEIRRHAQLLLEIAEWATGIAAAIAAVRGIVRAAHAVTHWVQSAVHALEREFHGIEHRVRTIEREIAHGIGHDVLARLKELERKFHGIESKVIPAIESEVATAEDDITALGEYIRAHYLANTTDAISAAVAVALAALGLGGLRCNSLLNSLSKRGCGLWNGLEDLLGLFIDALLLTHLCDLPLWVEEFFSPLLGDLTGLISSAASAVCAQANSSWATFNVPAGPLPPAQTTGPLAKG
jgi:hypothetical protein